MRPSAHKTFPLSTDHLVAEPLRASLRASAEMTLQSDRVEAGMLLIDEIIDGGAANARQIDSDDLLDLVQCIMGLDHPHARLIGMQGVAAALGGDDLVQTVISCRAVRDFCDLVSGRVSDLH